MYIVRWQHERRSHCDLRTYDHTCISCFQTCGLQLRAQAHPAWDAHVCIAHSLPGIQAVPAKQGMLLRVSSRHILAIGRQGSSQLTEGTSSSCFSGSFLRPLVAHLSAAGTASPPSHQQQPYSTAADKCAEVPLSHQAFVERAPDPAGSAAVAQQASGGLALEEAAMPGDSVFSRLVCSVKDLVDAVAGDSPFAR